MSFEKHEKEIENDYCCYWATACFLYVGLRVRTAYAGLSTRKLVSATRRIGGTSEPLKKKEELPNNPCAAAAPSLPYRWSHRKSRPQAAPKRRRTEQPEEFLFFATSVCRCPISVVPSGEAAAQGRGRSERRQVQGRQHHEPPRQGSVCVSWVAGESM
jgi:hypothetical protein